MKTILSIATSAFLLTACGSVPVLDAASAASIKGKTVVRAIPPAPKFQISTPGKALVGERLINATGAGGPAEPLDIADPSLTIAAQLAEDMDQRYGTKTVSAVLSAPGNMAQLAALALPHAEYALEVRTPMPSMNFYFTEPSRYRVRFSTYAALIDLKSQKAVSLAFCHYFPESVAGAATYDEMLKDNAKRLKQDIATGTTHCVKELKKMLFPV